MLNSPGYDFGGRDFGNRLFGSDVNGDGFADLVVNSPVSAVDFMEGATYPISAGRVYFYFGGPGGLSMSPIWFARSRPTEPMIDPFGFGDSLVGPGDLDADGIDDVVIVDERRDAYCFVRGQSAIEGARLSGCYAAPSTYTNVY